MREVMRDPRLFRIQLAFFGFSMAEYATWIAMLVYAYDRGGASATGIFATVLLVPAALVAPFGAFAGDRFRRDRVLFVSYLVPSLALGSVALALSMNAPLGLTLALAMVVTASLRFTRPTQAALLPSVSDGPEELTAANAVSAFSETAGIVVGPFVAGILLGRWGPTYVFAVFSVVLLVGALLVAHLEVSVDVVEPKEPMDAREVVRESLGGFRFLFGDRQAGLLILVMTAGLIVFGAMDVLFVVVAISLLGNGQSWAGFLSAAAGVGGLVGAALAISLIGRRRMVPALAAGMFVLGGAVAVVGIVPSALAVPLLFAVAGVGGAIEWVAGTTLLQRVAPDEVLTRVFGIIEGIGAFAWAIGSLMVSGLIAVFGVQIALMFTGLFAPAVMLVLWAPLASIDREAKAPDAEMLAFVRRMPIFAVLPVPGIERIANHLERLTVPAGEILIREGDVGDRLYIIVEGDAEVTSDGVHVADQTAGDHFGEIALLRGVPRTATVTAKTAMRLLTLEREPFLEAVTGHPQSHERAEAIVDERLSDRAEEP